MNQSIHYSVQSNDAVPHWTCADSIRFIDWFIDRTLTVHCLIHSSIELCTVLNLLIIFIDWYFYNTSQKTQKVSNYGSVQKFNNNAFNIYNLEHGTWHLPSTVRFHSFIPIFLISQSAEDNNSDYLVPCTDIDINAARWDEMKSQWSRASIMEVNECMSCRVYFPSQLEFIPSRISSYAKAKSSSEILSFITDRPRTGWMNGWMDGWMMMPDPRCQFRW